MGESEERDRERESKIGEIASERAREGKENEVEGLERVK